MLDQNRPAGNTRFNRSLFSDFVGWNKWANRHLLILLSLYAAPDRKFVCDRLPMHVRYVTTVM